MRLKVKPLARPSEWGQFFDLSGLDRPNLHEEDPSPTWRRTADHEAIRIGEADALYGELAQNVIAQAVQDARLTASSQTRTVLRARQWLRKDSADLRFWCIQAGLDAVNIVRWACAHFPESSDPTGGITRASRRRPTWGWAAEAKAAQVSTWSA